MRHTLYRRAFAIFCVILVFSQMVQVAAAYHQEQQRILEQGEPDEKTQLTLWYTDDKLNAYLVEAASDFEKRHHVEVTLQPAFPIWEVRICLLPPVSFWKRQGWPDWQWRMTAFPRESFRKPFPKRHWMQQPVAES